VGGKGKKSRADDPSERSPQETLKTVIHAEGKASVRKKGQKRLPGSGNWRKGVLNSYKKKNVNIIHLGTAEPHGGRKAPKKKVPVEKEKRDRLGVCLDAGKSDSWSRGRPEGGKKKKMWG